MNEEVKIYSIDEVLDSIGGYIDCSEFIDYEDDYQYSNIVYYLEKYKEQQEEIDRLNNIINELEKVFIECDYQHLQRKLKALKEDNK